MSHQKLFLAVCLVAALAAMALAAQNGQVTSSGCLQNLQSTAGDYGKQLQAIAMSFAQSMSKVASFDSDGFMKDINEIISGYMNIASPQASLTPKDIYDAITSLMGKQLDVFTKYIFNTSMGMGAMTAGTKALADILTLNTQTMGAMSAACIPGSA